MLHDVCYSDVRTDGEHVSRDAGARQSTPSSVRQTRTRTNDSTFDVDMALRDRFSNHSAHYFRVRHMHKSTQFHIDMLTRESTETLMVEAAPHDMQSHSYASRPQTRLLLY